MRLSASDEGGADLEVRRARVVVDAQGQPALAGDRGEVLEDLVFGERGVGHRRQQARRGSGGLGVLRQAHGVVGAKGADADEDGDLPARHLDG
jgi:hypothetical protein